MRIAVVYGFRTGQHHLLEEADDTLLGSCFAHCFVLQNHLTNLIAAFIDRVERGHGLLENHGNAFASYFGHLLFAEAFDFLAFDLDAVGRFARPRLAHKSQSAPCQHVEVDAMHGFHPFSVVGK